MKNSPTVSKLNLKEIFPFELDAFQKKAIAALDAGKSVVVCAPTGSGKTLIGEYAIYRALAKGKRVFYTTPLKALSNQKFRDFQEQFEPAVVGLITGDEVENPEGLIVVMTTEIFRNMLYETPIGQVGTSLEDVEAVVLDECHYISDRERGTVWEESIIYCPPTIQLVALSATIGNPQELTDWIESVRAAARTQENEPINNCELINSNFRPVPLRFYFSTNQGLFALLNSKQDKINPRFKTNSHKTNRKKAKIENSPSITTIVSQLQERDMLPAIYLIFSRRGCDRAVEEIGDLSLVNEEEARQIKIKLLQFFLFDNLELQEQLISAVNDTDLQEQLLGFLANNIDATARLCQFLADNPDVEAEIFQFLTFHSASARVGQVEPLLQGIAAHHAGILPAWKKLVEELFEVGLIKVVFATATLSAGINMPARTTVISALSKRSDDGHRLLTPSEFLQIAGRAGRRGMDTVGHVVTVQTRFEGAQEAAYLATATAEPLRSWFTPSYGMVLNLLQKHSIGEIKSLLERSFAEYLAQLQLGPEKETIAAITTELAKIDIELAPVAVENFASYEKLRERIKEEYRLLEILQQQAESSRKRDIGPRLLQIESGQIVALKGRHVKVASPLLAVLVAKVPGSGQAPDLVCLGSDNRWYVATNGDVADINAGILPRQIIEKLSVPEAETFPLGKWRKGNEESAVVSGQIFDRAIAAPITPEVRQQQKKLDALQLKLDNHPLQKFANPSNLIKRHKYRLELQEKLHRSQIKYQKHQSNKSYYWEEFLNLVEVLREFGALEGYNPTPKGVAAATIRGENELWLGLALLSGELEYLEPAQLAAVISALITETPRPDSWTRYQSSEEVLIALGKLQTIRKQLFKIQRRYDVVFPVWLERDFVGLVEAWTLGEQFDLTWNELCDNTSLDEGDLVRLLRRTIDVLWQIPQVPGISDSLKMTAKEAILSMKRFPI